MSSSWRRSSVMTTCRPYAILSHTWESGQEVTYQELLNGDGQQKSGYRKIRFCAEQAVKDGYHYFWVDTCCIDKTSSAELQEAINSMLKWYEQARVCYLYLSNVTDPTSIDGEASQFYKAKWHTCGWTLQELLAPSRVEFYSADCVLVGTKSSLCVQLTVITKIPETILSGQRGISSACVAQRMSWASQRKTSRPEDVAYCLMGMFGVIMPMLYGEGSKAFLRLQEEICRRIDDDSIFAWQYDPRRSGRTLSIAGLFAQHPMYFSHGGAISIESPEDLPMAQVSLSVAGINIDMSAHVLPIGFVGSRDAVVLILGCRLASRRGRLGILIAKEVLSGLVYARWRPDVLATSNARPQFSTQLKLTKTINMYSADWIPHRPIGSCRYELDADRNGHQDFSTSPIYATSADTKSWYLLGWIVNYILDEPLVGNSPRDVGTLTLRMDDGRHMDITFSINKVVTRNWLLDEDDINYVGHSSTTNWSHPELEDANNTTVSSGRDYEPCMESLPPNLNALRKEGHQVRYLRCQFVLRASRI